MTRALGMLWVNGERGAGALGLHQEVVDLRAVMGSRPALGSSTSQNRRVEGHGARQAGALLHAAGEVAGILS